MESFQLPKEKEVILKDNTNNIKVVAGPGSGKTTLIIEKIKRLVDSGVEPNKILVITYTNKAAEDLERKILKRLPIVKGFYVSTIHGFCTRFIRENPKYFQEYRDFQVLDDLGQFLFILKNISLLKTDSLPYMRTLVFQLKNYYGRIKDNYSDEELEKVDHPIKGSYQLYCGQLKYEKKFDFGDLINVVVSEINKNKELKKIAETKFDYLFIDEYQDINRTQERLIRLFHSKKNKVTVVGDVNQSIYGFRGADVRIFQNFNSSFDKYHKVKEYSLKINFRSTNNIIDLSNDFLKIPKEKRIIGDKKTKLGSKPKLFIYDNEKQEAQEIANYISKKHKNKKIKKLSDVGVLVGKKKIFKALIQEFDNIGLKYEVVGDGSLFQLDYIKAILDCYEQLARTESIKNDLLEINVKKDSQIYTKLLESKPLAVLFKLLEYSEFFNKAINDDDELIIYNVGKLTEIINGQQLIFTNNNNEKFIYGLKNLHKSFLDTEQPVHTNINSVKILTIHKSKGLEFPLVIIPGVTRDNYKLMNTDLVADLFPEYNEAEDSERAFYVGLTRAKQALITSYYKNEAEYIHRLTTSNKVEVEKFGHAPGGLNKFLQPEAVKIEDEDINSLDIKKEMISMTYYKLIEYWKCKFAYKLRFHYNMVVPYKGELGYGSKIHTLLQFVNLALLENPNFTWDEILEHVPEKHLDDYHKYKLKLTRYLSKLKNELKSIVKPELTFRFNTGNMIIDGRIDLLVKNKDDTYTIVEFKSGKYDQGLLKKQKEQLKAAKQQTELYALAIKKDYNITKGIVYFFGDGYKETFNIDRKEMDLKLINTIEEINKTNFEPNEDKKVCQSCVFSQYKICPYNKYKGNSPVIDDDNEEDFMNDCVNSVL